MRPWSTHPAHKNQHHHTTNPHKQKQKDKSEHSNKENQDRHPCTSVRHLNRQNPPFVSARNAKPSARQPQTTQQQNPRSQKISDSPVSRNTGKHFSHTPHRTTPRPKQQHQHKLGHCHQKTNPYARTKPQDTQRSALHLNKADTRNHTPRTQGSNHTS